MDYESFWKKNEWCEGGAFYCEGEQSLKFDPPCYIQRYATVGNLLREELKEKPGSKVVEFGCAELRFFQELKLIRTIEQVIEVDIDETLLGKVFFNTKPELVDYIRLRSSPFTVQVVAGSIDQYDTCLKGADVVVAIELIEHLHQDVLDRVPYNIFENIRPELAVITTPNADFNVAIPNFSGRRHYDHKFEWTRKEFTEWAFDVTEKYPDYTVLFYGIGQGPVGTEHLGCCSQMAIFRLKPGTEKKPMVERQKNYKLIREYEYPVDKTTPDQKIVASVNSALYQLTDKYDPFITEIPLEKFLIYLEDLCSDVKTLKRILETSGHTIRGTDAKPVLVVDNEEISEDDCDLGFPDSNETDQSCYQEDEDWDTPVNIENH